MTRNPLRWMQRALAALLLVLVAGCATQRAVPELPEELGNKGLLVARFYVLGMRGMENAGISIDGKLMNSSLRDGYVAVALEPGEHRMDQIRAQGQLLGSAAREDTASMRLASYQPAGYIYIPGGSYTVHYTTLSVNRSFTIEAGKVTNLGLIVYIPTEAKQGSGAGASRQFTVVALDNGSEAESFLGVNYPKQVAKLRDRTAMLAEGKYLAAEKLPDLRRVIGFHESRGPNVIGNAERAFVFGRAGTLVSLSKSGADAKPQLEVMETGTLADVVGATRRGSEYNFVTSNGRLITVEGSKLSSSLLPFKVQPVDLGQVGSKGLVAVDNRMRIMVQAQPGADWVSHEAGLIPDPRSDIQVLADQDGGSYVVRGFSGFSSAMYYLADSQAVPQALPMPVPPANLRGGPNMGESHFYVARKSGLFVLFDRPDYFYWSRAKNAWLTYARPAPKCKPMRIDEEGIHLKVDCEGVNYESQDSGATWKMLGT